MILHQDRYFLHLYEVKHDLISVLWPDIEDIYLPEILHSINALVANVRNYNICHLLVDASRSKVLSSYEEADQVVLHFLNGLATTQLTKLARIESLNAGREKKLAGMPAKLNLRFQFETRFFKEHDQARAWLETRK